jgi:hypothetical protein
MGTSWQAIGMVPHQPGAQTSITRQILPTIHYEISNTTGVSSCVPRNPLNGAGKPCGKCTSDKSPTPSQNTALETRRPLQTGATHCQASGASTSAAPKRRTRLRLNVHPRAKLSRYRMHTIRSARVGRVQTPQWHAKMCEPVREGLSASTFGGQPLPGHANSVHG